MNKKPALRFDHREIGVIFSLFVFVSLLMFTVGILVGKGLTQAQYENSASHPADGGEDIEPLTKDHEQHPGSSVSLGAPAHGETAAAAPHDKSPEPDHAAPAHAEAAKPETTAKVAEKKEGTESGEENSPLKLIPLKPTQAETSGVHLADPRGEAAELLKNPKILSLVEPEAGQSPAPTRQPTATSNPTTKAGSFTVQVGSYPNETAAQERVENLKKMGFPQAFFSAKELGSASGTWYRVWLGQYPDYQTAKKMGDQLQARGEVKNYIVNKSN